VGPRAGLDAVGIKPGHPARSPVTKLTEQSWLQERKLLKYCV